ncbi:hypothetical protein D917_02425 [Trichinella nativa]|uniref:Uncharacterized protein n=1 Tax=Trichinella nativa TaxID=6335 RepID=A0A1Y3EF88_9BILA|nr:hypothetical protein D917_02425 [Trichinella nativa]
MQQLPVFQQSKTKQKAQAQLGCNVVSVCFFAVLLTHLSADVFSEKRSLAASDTLQIFRPLFLLDKVRITDIDEATT